LDEAPVEVGKTQERLYVLQVLRGGLLLNGLDFTLVYLHPLWAQYVAQEFDLLVVEYAFAGETYRPLVCRWCKISVRVCYPVVKDNERVGELILIGEIV